MSDMNLLFITADQWRGEFIGAAGHPIARTPTLDALAASGVRFSRHYSTMSPCGPSRASIHTGLYGFNHRAIANGTPLDDRHLTFPELLRNAGLDPVLFGYTDIAADPRGLAPEDPRLTVWEGVVRGYRPIVELIAEHGPWLDHLGSKGYGRMSIEEVYDTPLGAPARFRAEDSETAFLTDAAMAHIAGTRAPWVVHLSYIKPHPPWIAAAPYHALHDPATLPRPQRRDTPEAEARLHPFLRAAFESGYGVKRNQLANDSPTHVSGLTDDYMALAKAVYYGLIAEVDAQLGRLVGFLAARGELERTRIVFTSDHGEMLGDHWLTGKHCFYPDAFHVPLIVADPAAPENHGRHVDRFTESIDLMPTFLAWYGIEPPLQCDGRDLSPLMTGDVPTDWRNAATYEHHFAWAGDTRMPDALGWPAAACQLTGRVDETHVTVQFGDGSSLLFDRRTDPYCFDDLTSTAPGLAAEKTRTLLTHRMTHAERRLSEARITGAGVIGRYQ